MSSAAPAAAVRADDEAGSIVRLWADGGHDAVENMRRDASLLDRAACEAGPVLRAYRFSPPGITVGYAQDPDAVLDVEACRRDGVRWAVRPTGGRAIFHDAEWTYAFAAAVDDPVWGGTLAETYARISRGIVDSLRRLGVEADLVPAGPRAAATAPGEPSCFASTARHEVLLDGRKLAGSAQRRTAFGYLQQGSILLGPGHLRLADYLRRDAEGREAAQRALRRNATPGVSLDPVADFDRWVPALEAAFGPAVRRFVAAPETDLLTRSKTHSYTPTRSQPTH